MIKTSFTIKDLENLSGVKAHTIRIWEKRYNLFEPQRSSTNIRSYDISSLRKILNIATLNNNGIKISKIAEMSDIELIDRTKKISVDNLSTDISDFLIAMMKFDQELFDKTYNSCIENKGFDLTFYQEIYTLLKHIGELWTCKTISPAHERFVSTMVKQKLLLQIEINKKKIKEEGHTYVLYLPENEMHDIGLLFIHCKLVERGFHSVFLGQNVPIEDLKTMSTVFSKISFISYFTVEPKVQMVGQYLEKLSKDVLSETNSESHILGRNTMGIDTEMKGINVYSDIHHLLVNM